MNVTAIPACLKQQYYMSETKRGINIIMHPSRQTFMLLSYTNTVKLLACATHQRLVVRDILLNTCIICLIVQHNILHIHYHNYNNAYNYLSEDFSPPAHFVFIPNQNAIWIIMNNAFTL